MYLVPTGNETDFASDIHKSEPQLGTYVPANKMSRPQRQAHLKDLRARRSVNTDLRSMVRQPGNIPVGYSDRALPGARYGLEGRQRGYRGGRLHIGGNVAEPGERGRAAAVGYLNHGKGGPGQRMAAFRATTGKAPVKSAKWAARLAR